MCLRACLRACVCPSFLSAEINKIVFSEKKPGLLCVRKKFFPNRSSSCQILSHQETSKDKKTKTNSTFIILTRISLQKRQNFSLSSICSRKAIGLQSDLFNIRSDNTINMTGMAFLSDEYATYGGLTVVLAHGCSHYFLSSINRRQLSARVFIRAVTSLVVMRAGTCCFTVIRSPPSKSL